MTAINSIISAIGNNNSIYPLIVRDCGIEVPTKVYKTYKQNEDNGEIAYLATRERIIDEYATSAVWLGGIPLIGKLCDKVISLKGYNPITNIKLIQAEEELKKLDESVKQYEIDKIPKELLKKREQLYAQSLSGNIEKFSKISGAEDAVENLKKVQLNQSAYKKLQAGKLFAQMAIPIALMGFIIPKAVYAMTAATRKKMETLQKGNNVNKSTLYNNKNVFDKFQKGKNITFGSSFASTMCDLSTVQKMAITDGGYAVGRVATARKKRGAIDIGFKMFGMMYLNFVAPKQIEKILSLTSKKMFNLDVNLDPVILGDKEFISQINSKTLKLPQTNNIKDMLEFIDNPENSKSLFVKYAQKFRNIKMINDNIRDPRAWVDEEKLAYLRDNMEMFMNEASSIRKNALEKTAKLNITDKNIIEQTVYKYVKKYASKAKAAKTFNIISNVALSSYLLACVLPDAQYFLREKILGTKLEPDLL